MSQCKKRYGFWHFCGDLFLTFITCGLWLIWLVFKALHEANN